MNRILLVVCLLSLSAPIIAGNNPSEAALLIIDVQDFYFPGGTMPLVAPEDASANIARLLERWRVEGGLVVHVGHQVSQGGGFHPDAAPVEDEAVFMKNEVNAFLDTGLLEYLHDRQVKSLVVVGMQTHMCLEGAVRAASDLGFDCHVVADACATRNLEYGDHFIPAAEVHDATLSSLHRVYAIVTDTESLLAAE